MRRHAAEISEHDSHMMGLGSCRQNGIIKNGINTGAIIPEPNEHVLDNMLQQMDSDAWSWLFKRMPEQEFLTLHFQGKRYNLRVEYNFQTKQIVFTNRKGLECCRWLAQKMT